MPVTDSCLILTFPQFFYLESDLKYRLSRNCGTGVRLDPVPVLTLIINIFYTTFLFKEIVPAYESTCDVTIMEEGTEP